MDRIPVSSPVVITGGDLRGHEGTLESLDNASGTATVRLTVFGRDVSVEISRGDISVDLAGFRGRQLEARRQEYQQWCTTVYEKLARRADSAPVPQEIFASYFNPGVGASGLRLTLAEDGMLLIEMWADLGGSWLTLHNGFFLVDGGVLRTNVNELSFCDSSFATDGLLHIREVDGQLVLAPCSAVEKLDELLRTMPAGIERLPDTFLGLELFFKQDAAN